MEKVVFFAVYLSYVNPHLVLEYGYPAKTVNR